MYERFFISDWITHERLWQTALDEKKNEKYGLGCISIWQTTPAPGAGTSVTRAQSCGTRPPL